VVAGHDGAVTSWTPDWAAWPPALLDFWTERHLCTLTTLRTDGRPHVVPVGVALDPEQRCAWVITSATSRKARNLAHSPHLAACQVDGRRWSTVEGRGSVITDPGSVRRAEERYAVRYRTPRENPARVAIRIDIDRILMSGDF